jgi:alkylated DNA repair protein (DNA oxidative demethylase)
MSLHQDRDERDLTAPIVSVSLGLPAVFLWGGLKRKDPTHRFPLAHGDILVWGGPDRLRDHGVRPLQAGSHPALGEQRIHLTFRQVGSGIAVNIPPQSARLRLGA